MLYSYNSGGNKFIFQDFISKLHVCLSLDSIMGFGETRYKHQSDGDISHAPLLSQNVAIVQVSRLLPILEVPNSNLALDLTYTDSDGFA